MNLGLPPQLGLIYHSLGPRCGNILPVNFRVILETFRPDQISNFSWATVGGVNVSCYAWPAVCSAVCGGRYGQLYGKLESIIDSNVCRAGELCGVERKGEGGWGGYPIPAIHISPYLPITSSVRIHDTEAAAADLSQSVQFPNANVSFQIPFKEGNYKCNLSLPVFVAHNIKFSCSFIRFYTALFGNYFVLCFKFETNYKQQCSHPSLATKPDYIVLTFMKVRQTQIPSCLQ